MYRRGGGHLHAVHFFKHGQTPAVEGDRGANQLGAARRIQVRPIDDDEQGRYIV